MKELVFKNLIDGNRSNVTYGQPISIQVETEIDVQKLEEIRSRAINFATRIINSGDNI
ncbi:MAG: hypothetical protein WC679_00545 [Bacteroidales bacterium]|jgi:hypothetical protein